MRGNGASILLIGLVWGLCVLLVLIGIGTLAVLCMWLGRRGRRSSNDTLH
ncbi:hypothetical protein LX81_03563 [Palleronia aestuarii]|uniref:Uncharacterized protein n=1 Tax=Palleronia aestuarii TaxID=568105 RepID=A0A2W7PSM9_9RHOB|nr:hypothetical protein LX81_03563 [Palleronia aestuarii]